MTTASNKQRKHRGWWWKFPLALLLLLLAGIVAPLTAAAQDDEPGLLKGYVVNSGYAVPEAVVSASGGGIGTTGWVLIGAGAAGLVTAIAQDIETNDVLMLAWMNRDALERTVREGEAVYWSRSRGRLWRKGERSGHLQRVKEIRIDCDDDTVLLKIEQIGGAEVGQVVQGHIFEGFYHG